MKNKLKLIGFTGVLVAFLMVLPACTIIWDPPGTPTISITVSATTTTIDWWPTLLATGYIVYRGPISGGDNPNTFNELARTTNLYYTDNTDTDFFYAVKAYHSDGTSAFSNVMRASKPPAAPVITEVHDAGETTISWDAVPGAAKYIVLHGNAGATSVNGFTILGDTTETTYKHTTTTARSYAVRAANADDFEGPASNIVTPVVP